MTGLGFVGCGYAADFYAANLANHPDLNLVGCHDIDGDRVRRFAAFHGARVFPSLAELLAAAEVEVVVNLTNPSSHAEVTRAALASGKHVYSEKPFAATLEEGRGLVALARARGLGLESAPCTASGDAFQTLLARVRAGAIGEPLLAACHCHEGAVHQMGHGRWVSPSGAPWPAADEFATGCVREHGGYVLDLLVALLGSIRTVSAETALFYPDKGVGTPVAPDWASAVLGFDRGALARVSTSLVEPEDRRLVVTGSGGVLTLQDIWRYDSPVVLRRARRPDPSEPHRYLGPPETVAPLEGPARPFRYRDSHDVDHMRGVAGLVSSVRAGRPADGGRALHVLEATLLIAAGGGARRAMSTASPPHDPPPWALR